METFVGNDHLKEMVQMYIDTNDPPHLLFHGKAGTGKTTLSKIIHNNIDCDHLYINASDKGGVDYIRTDIIPFASSIGFSPLKLVILDECLDENTLVTVLRKGQVIQVPISSVDEKADLVKSFNVENKTVEWRPFHLWDKGEQDAVEIEFANGDRVICTLDHKWYIENENGDIIVVKTSELTNGDKILTI